MLIRCWGARGSIPVSGSRFNKYGGDTACIEIRSKTNDVVVIDAGSGIRCLGDALLKEPPCPIAMLFTHAHIDHLVGFPFFVPLFSSKFSLALYGPKLNKPSFKSVLSGFLEQPYFPVQIGDRDIRAKLSFKDIGIKPFTIGSLSVATIPLSHPRNGGLGYRITEGEQSFVFLTDNELAYQHTGGCSFDEYAQFCAHADLLIHDAEYTPKEYNHIRATSQTPWGHSCYTDVVRLAVAAGVKNLGLFHHNQRRTDAQIDAIVKKTQTMIKKNKTKVACNAIGTAFQTTL